MQFLTQRMKVCRPRSAKFQKSNVRSIFQQQKEGPLFQPSRTQHNTLLPKIPQDPRESMHQTPLTIDALPTNHWPHDVVFHSGECGYFIIIFFIADLGGVSLGCCPSLALFYYNADVFIPPAPPSLPSHSHRI